MLDITFEEFDTFQTPDGKIWIVNPLKRKDLKIIYKFTEMNEQVQKAKEEGNEKESNKLVFGDDEDSPSLLDVTDELIDLSIVEVKTGEKFPEKYRRNILKAIELCNIIIKATVGVPDSVMGDDTPLPENKSSNE